MVNRGGSRRRERKIREATFNLPGGLGRSNPSTPHWLSRASVGLQLVLLCAVYSQARGCVCAALQLGGDAEQPWLMSKHDVIRKTGST